MGWSIIGITVFNMAVNLSIMLYKSISSLKILFFKIKQKYLLWKMSKCKKHLIETNEQGNI
jgi:hypothetical protein